MQATSNPTIPASGLSGFFTPRNINRILLVLGFLGIFDASLLSGEVLFHLNLSCGAEGGCAQVASHKSAFWFGQPVAYFGFVAYVAFAGLAAIRAILGSRTPKVLTYGALSMSIFGALTSIYLQYMALIVIGAFCPYCFGSAVNMILTMVLYAMLTSRIGAAAAPGAVTEAEAEAEYPRVEPEPIGRSDVQWVAIGSLATLVAVIFGATYLQSMHKPPVIAPNTLDLTKLVPLKDDVHGYGDPNAPVKITEFADFCCPHCQSLTPKLHQFIDQHPGKVYAIWRNFPLRTTHPMAVTAAMVAEYAARHGKFWEYSDKIFAGGVEPKSWDDLAATAKAVGLDLDDLQREISRKDCPELVDVTKDMADASYLGINETPTFFVQAKGVKTRIAPADDVFDVLSGPPFKDLVDK